MSDAFTPEEKTAIIEKVATHEATLANVDRDIVEIKKDIEEVEKEYEAISDLAYSVKALVDKFDTPNNSVHDMKSGFKKNLAEVTNEQVLMAETVNKMGDFTEKHDKTASKFSDIKWGLVNSIINLIIMGLVCYFISKMVPWLPIN